MSEAIKEINLTIDGKDIVCLYGDTIVVAAAKQGIGIPTFCASPRFSPSGECGICVVEIQGFSKPARACSTLATEGMVVATNSEKIKALRKNILELLLSDHKGDCVAPCKRACPANTDCQGYVGLIANGAIEEATNLIYKALPLPLSIGKVCPHPCEKECRRKLVDEPIAIASLKAYAASTVGAASCRPQAQGSNDNAQADDTGKHVAIIGGGPGGLSAAYYLKQNGHAVTIFDAAPKMGGMLLYGVPEYRLPKQVLAQEVDYIKSTGVTFKNNVRIGRDISFDEIKANHDVVIVAIGAHKGTALRCEGDDLDGVISGVDFLREVSGLGQDAFSTKYLSNIKNKAVAVVGGGDTAMDACRTAVRLGAKVVYNIYRRAKEQMPANLHEIVESEEEGIVLKTLTNPIKLEGDDDGKLKNVLLQKMALGEPDASGRRSPIVLEGQTENLVIDTLITMIGQGVDASGLEALERTKWGTIIADEKTFSTNLTGVFAVGDATNNGAGLAVEAIGEAGRCAKIVDTYLKTGLVATSKKRVLVTDNKTVADFSSTKKAPRQNFKQLAPKKRCNNFDEVNATLSEAAAKKEANRCLECGCADYFGCKLIEYANDYAADVNAYAGDKNAYTIDNSSSFITRDSNKCIQCGKCIKVCESGILGLIGRGFSSQVRPALDKPLAKTDCTACGMCAAVCPVGALTEKAPALKTVPLATVCTISTCELCDTKCAIELHTHGNVLVKITPTIAGKICPAGRFLHTGKKFPKSANRAIDRIAASNLTTDLKEDGKL